MILYSVSIQNIISNLISIFDIITNTFGINFDNKNYFFFFFLAVLSVFNPGHSTKSKNPNYWASKKFPRLNNFNQLTFIYSSYFVLNRNRTNFLVLCL